MALPDYFQRSAVAASQVLGWNADAIAEHLDNTVVGISIGNDADSPEGKITADLTVRLLARLYPRINLEATHPDLARLAHAINPQIDLTGDAPDVAVAIGNGTPGPKTIYVGSSGWDAFVSSSEPRPIGETHNPFGACAAACFGAANLFRLIFLADDGSLDHDLAFSTLDLAPAPTVEPLQLETVEIGDGNVLVGLGAIGNAVVYALGHLAGLSGSLELVDHESVELGNLQRYVLTTRSDEDHSKASLAAEHLRDRSLTVTERELEWAAYASEYGYNWRRVLVALDSARDRRAVQASLPAWIANAWTQPEDLGVSTHSWRHGACLTCLYLPAGQTKSEDKLIAEALGIARPDLELQIRQLLHAGAAPPPEFLEEVASALDVPIETLEPFREKPLRELYTEGVCGGAVLPLDRQGPGERGVHVPLAHQSALAGIFLAGRLVADALGGAADQTLVTRIDLMTKVAEFPTQLAQKDPRGICICQDPTYVHAYDLKYRPPR